MKTLTITEKDGVFEMTYKAEGKNVFALTNDITLRIEEFYALDCEDDKLQFCEDTNGHWYNEINNLPMERIK